jgi:hypothetical protein
VVLERQLLEAVRVDSTRLEVLGLQTQAVVVVVVVTLMLGLTVVRVL